MFRRPPFSLASRLRSAQILAVALTLTPLLQRPADAHGSHDELVGELLEELQLKPNDPSLLLRLASANCEHGDWETALSYLDMVERLAPGQFRTEVVRGQSLFTAGKYRQAIKSLDGALVKEPHNPRAHLFRARSHAALEQVEPSLTDYRTLSAETTLPEPAIVLETANALARWKRVPEAIDLLADGLAKIGPEPSLVLRAMELELSLGQYDSALTRVEAMQRSAPRPETWMVQRALLLEQAGRADAARQAWTTLLAHLAKLPSLERGSPEMDLLARQARRSLGAAAIPAPVFAPPATQISSASTVQP
jgi:tetratricopeptide (TPR) repeat protein